MTNQLLVTCCVNQEGSGDMYPKGALLLNTLRHVINNDELMVENYLKIF